MRYNSPPGWPTPPEGWSPPPGWQPDPSWGPAPEGWQFWVEDGDAAAGEAPTESFQDQPPSAAPGTGAGPGATAAYQYDASGQLEDVADSPYDTGFLRSGAQGGPPPGGYAQGQPEPGGYAQGQPEPGGYAQGQPEPGGYAQGQPQPGGYAQGQPQPGGYAPGSFAQQGGAPQPGGYAPGGYPQQGAPGPQGGKSSNKGVLIGAAVLGVLLLAGLVWGGIAIFGGDDEPTDPPPTATDPTDDPTDEPTEDPTDDPTDDPTEDPTDDPTDEETDEPADPPASGETLSLGEAAVIDGTETNPGATIAITDVEAGWSDSSEFLCDNPELGDYYAVSYEVVTYDVQEPFDFSSLNLTLADADGNEIEEINPFMGLMCSASDGVPSELDAESTYNGVLIFDGPPETSAVMWREMFSFGNDPSYVWAF